MLLLQQRIFDWKNYETGGMIIMIKRYKWTLLAASLMILCPIIIGIIFWDQLPDMIPIPEDFDLTNKKYVGGKWESYTPAPPPEPQPSEMDMLKARVAEIENGQNAMISGAQEAVKNESSQAHA